VHENLKAVQFVDQFTPEIMARIDEIFWVEKEEDDE